MKNKRKIYEEVDGIFYNSVEQVVSELSMPKHLVMKSLKTNMAIKYNGYIYRFTFI